MIQHGRNVVTVGPAGAAETFSPVKI